MPTSTVMKMKDRLIRGAFHKSILELEHQTSDTFVINELGLKNGQSRADIAVLNGKFIGYEIKTEQDNLNRLSSQVEAYSEVFDKIYIVTANKHLNSVLKIVPDWWGIYLIEVIEGDYQFKVLRKAKRNRVRQSFSIAQLLWKEEVIDILVSKYDVKLKSNIDKHQLYQVLTEKCTTNLLSKLALRYLKNRKEWRINQKSL